MSMSTWAAGPGRHALSPHSVAVVLRGRRGGVGGLDGVGGWGGGGVGYLSLSDT